MSILAKFEPCFFILGNKKPPKKGVNVYLNIFKPIYLKSKNPKHIQSNSINVINILPPLQIQ